MLEFMDDQAVFRGIVGPFPVSRQDIQFGREFVPFIRRRAMIAAALEALSGFFGVLYYEE